jgi:hypothetical protein
MSVKHNYNFIEKQYIILNMLHVSAVVGHHQAVNNTVVTIYTTFHTQNVYMSVKHNYNFVEKTVHYFDLNMLHVSAVVGHHQAVNNTVVTICTTFHTQNVYMSVKHNYNFIEKSSTLF